MEIIKSENDFYTSVEKSFEEISPKWKDLKGLVVVGSHLPSDIEKKLEALKRARENGIPTLGICFGLQLMVIEYARNVLGIKDATSEEIGEGTLVVNSLPKLHVGIDRVAGWWGTTDESHWHNFAFNVSFVEQFEKDWELSIGDGILEIMRLKKHPFFVGVQFHPEYQSSKERPHPVLADFLKACKKK